MEQLEEETAAGNAAAPTVDVVPVKYSAATESIVLPGETRAWFESTIYARTSGYVDQWLVDIGDEVAKGEVLATIDTPELDAQLSAAQAKLVAAQAEEKVAEAAAGFRPEHLFPLARLSQRRCVGPGTRIEEGGLRQQHRQAECCQGASEPQRS